MAGNYYSEINLHIVWHTKQSRPILTPEIERKVHSWLTNQLMNQPGVFVHEVGGTETHIHLAVTVPPTLTISECVGRLKGGSSHEINHHNPTKDRLLQWQTGYGVVSFGTKDLDWVKRYVRNQKDHDAGGRTHQRLEAITELRE